MPETYCLMYGGWHGIDLVKRGLSRAEADAYVKKLEKKVAGAVWAITESEYKAALQAELIREQKCKAKKAICPHCGKEM
jgi:hypothetical protein